jgi:hypothetical protein
MAALAAVAVVLIEAAVIIGTGKLVSSYDASAWFSLFQENRLVGLIDCAVLDIAVAVLLAPMFLALRAVLEKGHRGLSTIAVALALLGIAIYVPTNRAVFLLDASDLYAAAASEAQRSMYLAQGQALMGLGRFGMFWSVGFFVMSAGVLILSASTFRDGALGKAVNIVGILGSFLIIANGLSLAIVPVDVGWISTILAGSGGLLSMAWWILVGLRLLRLGRRE